jgi:hypothetical protein
VRHVVVLVGKNEDQKSVAGGKPPAPDDSLKGGRLIQPEATVPQNSTPLKILVKSTF